MNGWRPISSSDPHVREMNGTILEGQPELGLADPNEILTVHQAAVALKVSYSHMLRLIRGEVSGMPPVHHVRAGRSVRVRRGALTDWIRDVERLSTEAPASRAGA
jgi:excisionase family DNA binding protein